MLPYKGKSFCSYDQVKDLDMGKLSWISFTDKKNSPKCINKQNDQILNIF